MKKFLIFVVLGFIASACQNDQPKKVEVEEKEKPKVQAPKFNAENAFKHIEKQLSFGPRVPGTKAHDSCATWLETQFRSFGAEVIVQKTELQGASKAYKIKNIIAVYNPAATKRVLLCAHWDSREMADQDTERKNEPIPGADDGGSGVGVLLEIARILNENKLKNLGVDIVLFDAEDQGLSGNGKRDSWCLGAQHWSKNPHVPNYKANFGILLDMVGARNAKFPKEGLSIKHASFFVERIWNTAWALGYSDFFVNTEENQIVDDHLYINEIRKIPTVDIIHLSPDSPTGFGAHWHTHKDNIDIIGKNTLLAVGQTVVQVLYEEDMPAK